MCLTNIDIVDGIDCLQVLQHADGSEKYLTVRTGWNIWIIGDTIDGLDCGSINSASAGDCCPASAANRKSDRMQLKSWSYWDGKAWVECDIRVKCVTHS